MKTLQLLEDSRKQVETRLLMFPEWFVKSEYKVLEYMVGGSMCRSKGLTIDFFETISFIKYEKCPIKKEWIIQALTNNKGTTTIITLIKR